ncbi:CHAP domain-containing protein [Actinoplanes sp. TRM 88003]|uniref:CHAP domain-containing protein n=1 Tax=Paractinoplanes aksuensis TaxID=2939490 RepID=A0ABT1E3W8_9ACTN|nr:CHAP domain-containing protein [Actinoplanes aksuensis]MCO8276820.1 CHAP domain-containing protein [Actinoplanes aksuensis]
MTHHRSPLRGRSIAALTACAVAATGLTVVTGAGAASAAANSYRSISVTADGSGYVLTNTGGGTYAFGSVRYRGNPAGFSGEIVGVSATADGSGYAAISSRGQVYAYGTVTYRGNPTGFSGDIVGVSVTADGSGYAAVSSTGQVYAYGSVRYHDNPRGFTGRIVGISATADGSGYAAVSSAGQVYAYGTVAYRGNPAGFSGQIAGISATANGSGYAAISSTGQVYAYGTVAYRGNPTGFTNGISGISVSGNGSGYAAVSGIGQVYAYGTVAYRGNADPGSTAPSGLRARIVERAIAELNNTSRNNGARPSKCNFYSGTGTTGAVCTGPNKERWRSQDWCADFTRWVWGQSGANVGGLTAGAVSFKKYGDAKRTWVPGNTLAGVQPGDAIVYDVNNASTWASHVGVVVAVGNTTVTTIDGNFSGGKIVRSTVTRGARFGSKTISGYARPVS